MAIISCVLRDFYPSLSVRQAVGRFLAFGWNLGVRGQDLRLTGQNLSVRGRNPGLGSLG